MEDISRFYEKHTIYFPAALREIQHSYKQSHWMWYIFPQLRGLGRSLTSWEYGLAGLEEARAFAADAVLGENLRTITRALLEQPCSNAAEIFGDIDTDKLRSCMTLFFLADPECGLYGQVLERFFDGQRDFRTLQMLKN